MKAFRTQVKRMVRRRTLFIAAMVMAFISAAGLGAGLLGLGPLLEQILNPESGTSLQQMAADYNADAPVVAIPDGIVSWLPTTPVKGVIVLISGLWLLTVLGAAANFLHQFMAQTLVTVTVADIRRDVADRALHLPLTTITTRGASEFVARLVRDAIAVEAGLLALVGKGIAHLTKGAAALAAAIVFDPRVVIIVLIVGPVLALVLRKLAKRVHRGTKGSLEAQQEMLSRSTEVLQGIRGIRTASAEDDAMRRIEAANQSVVRHELRIRTAKALSSPLLETLAILVMGVLAVLAAREIIAGSLSFERFILALGSLAVAAASMRPLAGLINAIASAEAPASRLQDTLAAAPEAQGDGELARHASSIAFEAVQYTYPGADSPAVQVEDLRIGFGEHVAFVGANGSGKTSMLSLLPRLLVPEYGTVSIDGTDIATVTLPSLRQQIAVVTQEPLVLRGTIEENITLGYEADAAAIEAAAEAGRAMEFITALPEGMQTQVAEGGASLSGGQRQRLSIARAMLRDPSILILDEATSQVDSASESLIAEAIKSINGRTVLVIAHRLATVVDCDRIVVLDGGAVVDQGTHAELLNRCSLYESLVRTQLVQVEA